MSLVDYSDSDTEVSGPNSQSNRQARPRSPQIENQQSMSSSKRKHDDFAETYQSRKPVPPPLPSAFHSLYVTNVRTSTSDDPSLHGGRKRQMPHVEGNWQTHAYLEWYPSRAELAILETTIRTVQAKVPGDATSSSSSKVCSLLQSELAVQLPLHISLSASLMLRTEQRPIFLEKLQGAVEGSGVKPFQVHVTGLDWVPNSERTRWFLVLKLKRPENDGLNLLLAITNYVAKDSGLEMLYTDHEFREDGLLEKESPRRVSHAGKRGLNHRKHKDFSAIMSADYTSRFHFSIAWQLEEPSKESIANVNALQPDKDLNISCDCLKVKIGNAIHDIPLLGCRLSEEVLGRI